MFRFDRLFQRLLPSWVIPLWVTASLLQPGCTLITDVDRSKIPQPPTIEPDPQPSDAGTENPLPDTADAGGDAALADDSTPDAAPSEPELDAGATAVPDAQADGG